MRRVDALLVDYGSHHRTRGNLICHVFGVTLIVYGLLSLLALIPIGPGGLTAAEGLLAGAFLFYLSLHPGLALGVLAAAGLLDVVVRAVDDWRIGVGAFVVGWIFQAVGHARFEKNSPAFFHNLVHLLVGPLFLVNELLKIRPSLRATGATE
jgi:uncharacterized membrane protein YGL010W